MASIAFSLAQGRSVASYVVSHAFPCHPKTTLQWLWLLAPIFTVQPVGTVVTLSGSAVVPTPIAYQWYSAPTNSATFTALTGQTGTSCSFTPTKLSSSGSYYLQATNIYGSSLSTTVTVQVIPPLQVSISYPIGTYTDTNLAPAQLYMISSP